jgi:hypothetical protein
MIVRVELAEERDRSTGLRGAQKMFVVELTQHVLEEPDIRGLVVYDQDPRGLWSLGGHAFTLQCRRRPHGAAAGESWKRRGRAVEDPGQSVLLDARRVERRPWPMNRILDARQGAATATL